MSEIIGAWFWPQWTQLALYSVAALIFARDHGKPKTGKDNFWLYAMTVGISTVILYSGGFWTPGRVP